MHHPHNRTSAAQLERYVPSHLERPLPFCLATRALGPPGLAYCFLLQAHSVPTAAARGRSFFRPGGRLHRLGCSSPWGCRRGWSLGARGKESMR